MEFPLTDDQYNEMLKLMPNYADKSLTDAEAESQGSDNKSHTLNSLSGTPYEAGCSSSTNAMLSSLNSVIPPIISGSYIDGHILQDSDEETESVESGMIDEDPNDPEWCEPPSRL